MLVVVKQEDKDFKEDAPPKQLRIAIKRRRRDPVFFGEEELDEFDDS